MAVLLKFWGHQAHVALSGVAALEVAALHPDAVLLDLALPGEVDGFEVALRLRQCPDTKEILILAISGCVRAEDRRRALDAGLDHFLLKPADPEEIRALLARAAQTVAETRRLAGEVRDATGQTQDLLLRSQELVRRPPPREQDM
jgi:CheY-like chemotaxis protein